jgi:EAL domain-containing protein (putative c-di-GMP-specific phosphodiesterase class I)
MSVNVSARQFREPRFVPAVEALLRELKVPWGRLKLELTESALMEHSEAAIEVLGRLRQLGLGLAIDDFGTGYSSLSYLKRFPVDTLKIDRSFVHDIPGDQTGREIASAIVAMARKLGIEAIAEGIETEDQRRFLLENGCRCGQGYRFGRPVPIAEIRARLAAGACRASDPGAGP